MTLYLKYRPQKISELDSQFARKSLENILSLDSLPHAFLFTGTRGVGKTSAARILAKSILCKKRKGVDPCGLCESCVAISNGSHPDVMEMDAASNRGIDEIRVLREQVGLMPIMGSKKIYIVDEVHMLTSEASNALLKTLEEPPAHVVFVLCTTDSHKILDTVKSRCIQIDFLMPSIDEIESRLTMICKSENKKLDAREINAIAKMARGSFRDAVKILEQAFAWEGDLDDFLSSGKGIGPEDFVNAIRGSDRDKALGILNELHQRGTNIKDYVENLVLILRDQMLAGDREAITFIEDLMKVYEQLRYASVLVLPLEIMVVEKWCKSAKETKKEEVKEKIKLEPLAREEKREEKKEEKSESGEDRLGELLSSWNAVYAAVRPKNHSVEGLLRATKPLMFDGKNLTLEVFYKFHKDKLETEKCRQIVEEGVAQVMNVSKVRLKLVNGTKEKGKKESEDIADVAVNIFK